MPDAASLFPKLPATRTPDAAMAQSHSLLFLVCSPQDPPSPREDLIKESTDSPWSGHADANDGKTREATGGSSEEDIARTDKPEGTYIS